MTTRIIILIAIFLLSGCATDTHDAADLDIIYQPKTTPEKYYWNFKKLDDNSFSVGLAVDDGHDTRTIIEQNVHGQLRDDLAIGDIWHRDTLTFTVPFSIQVKPYKTTRGTIVKIRGL
jgi:hypothetical protein